MDSQKTNDIALTISKAITLPMYIIYILDKNQFFQTKRNFGNVLYELKVNVFVFSDFS